MMGQCTLWYRFVEIDSPVEGILQYVDISWPRDRGHCKFSVPLPEDALFLIAPFPDLCLLVPFHMIVCFE